jgi:hypothetical protein
MQQSQRLYPSLPASAPASASAPPSRLYNPYDPQNQRAARQQQGPNAGVGAYTPTPSAPPAPRSQQGFGAVAASAPSSAPAQQGSAPSSVPAQEAPQQQQQHTASAKNTHLTVLLVVGGLFVAFLVWYFATQHPDKPTPPRAPTVRDLTGRTYALAWSSDPVDPRPVVLATPPVTPGSSASYELLYSFNSSYEVTCGTQAPALKQNVYKSALSHLQALQSLSVPEGMHPTSLKRLATTRVLLGRGSDGSTWVPVQASLWLTPHGLVIGDPKLQSKVNAGRFDGSETQVDYAAAVSPTTAQNNINAGLGGVATTPLELLPPAALASSSTALNRLLEFRTSPYAYWNIQHGSLVSAVDSASALRWPFYPTALDTKVVWSIKTLTESAARVLEFLDNGDLRIVDRSLKDGSLMGPTKWLASGDVRSTDATSNGCSIPPPPAF